ncbi:MAG: hypothetical protein V3W08_05305 [Candidatus Binatia bacterium]
MILVIVERCDPVKNRRKSFPGHRSTKWSRSTRLSRPTGSQDDTHNHIPLAGFARNAQLQAEVFSGGHGMQALYVAFRRRSLR